MVSNSKYTQADLVAEMNKCDMRCVNHHRIITRARGMFKTPQDMLENANKSRLSVDVEQMTNINSLGAN